TQAAQNAKPLPAAVLTDGSLPAGTQVLLGWPRAQLPAGWVASRAYMEVPQVIVRREGAAAVLGLEDLRGRSVASPDRLPLAAVLAEQAPGAQLLAPAPLDHALSLLRAGLVDAVVANLAEVEAALRAEPGDALVIA
ncbi:transporter substrate-binding domain-containing protein, partial [Campylobacter lari]|nr:transporter substrate-binding domain-containing protein [Campylobacter lari]